MGLKLWFMSTLFILQACVPFHLKTPRNDLPLSMTGYISGHNLVKTSYHFREEVWIYFILGLAELSFGTFRDDFRYDYLLEDIARKHIKTGQGVTHLKISSEKSLPTILVTFFTLGILAPVSVEVEGDVVEIVPQSRGIQP